MDIIRKQKNKEETQNYCVRFSDAQKRLAHYHDNPRRALRLARAGFRSHFFYTEDSGRYVTPRQRAHMARGEYPTRTCTSFDAIRYRYSTAHTPWSMSQIHTWRMQPLRTAYASWRGWWHFDISPVRAWNLSLIGAILFGMISMTMIYRSFGQFAFATEPSATPVHNGYYNERSVEDGAVAPVTVAAREIAAQSAAYVVNKKQGQTTVKRDPTQIAFEKRAREMVKGYPIEKMLPEIFKQDRVVASFLIAIAKQESQWGKRVPVLHGEDCYNYWGFRAKRARMGTGGHTCFDSRADAVTTVGRRIHDLVYKYNKTTADRLIVWKCGYSCQGHDPGNVVAWKRTVQRYYDALMKE